MRMRMCVHWGVVACEYEHTVICVNMCEDICVCMRGSVCIPECMCVPPCVVGIKGGSKGEARLLVLEGRNVQSKADPTCPLPAVSVRVLFFTQQARLLEQTLWQGCGLSGNTSYVV